MSNKHGIRMPVIPCSEEAPETALQALRERQRSWCDYYFIFLSWRLADPGEVLRASLNVQIVFTRLLKASGTQANELQSCRRSLAARRHFLAQLQTPVCPTAPLCAQRRTQRWLRREDIWEREAMLTPYPLTAVLEGPLQSLDRNSSVE